LTADTPTPSVKAGGTLSAKLAVRRNWPEFQGAIQLSGLLLPPGFEIANVEVPAKSTEVAVRFTVAADVPPGRYTLALRGESQVPFSPDPTVAGAEKPTVRVADPSTPLVVTVTAPPSSSGVKGQTSAGLGSSPAAPDLVVTTRTGGR